MAKRVGAATIEFETKPRVASYSSTGGVKEGVGPLGKYIDHILKDDLLGQKTWEWAEAAMLRDTVTRCLDAARLIPKHNSDDNYNNDYEDVRGASPVDALLCGDLINQIMASNLAARELNIPMLGLYGACSTMSEALTIGAALIDGGSLRRAVCAASSHFSTAERQYRLPLEQGGQRPASAQWTVTGAGATLLCHEDYLPPNIIPHAVITHATIGRVRDYGVHDMSNMGAVMAPAAADTIARHLRDTKRAPDYYDEIITGDLGIVGRDLMLKLLEREGFHPNPDKVWDCGARIFSPDQDAHAGGSGCGCSASVLNGYILKRFAKGELNRVAFMATGALLNATSVLQGESIPGIAHLVVIEGMRTA